MCPVCLTRHRARLSTLQLLLDRGADPNVSKVPVPVLILAIMAADAEAVQKLLLCGARTDMPLPPEVGIDVSLPLEDTEEPNELYLKNPHPFCRRKAFIPCMSLRRCLGRQVPESQSCCCAPSSTQTRRHATRTRSSNWIRCVARVLGRTASFRSSKVNLTL